MGKINICDLCRKEIMQRYSDETYRFTVKKRFFGHSGVSDGIYTGTVKLDICADCMSNIIVATTPPKLSKQQYIKLAGEVREIVEGEGRL